MVYREEVEMERVYNVQFHSMVDLITNSSSVVYVTANADAVDRIHELVDALLAIGGSELKSKDLFNIGIIPDFDKVMYKIDGYESEAELRDGFVDDLPGEVVDWMVTILSGEWDKNHVNEFYRLMGAYPEAAQYLIANTEDEYGYYESRIRVVSKGSGENEQVAAAILSNLDGLFGYEATYN